MIRIAKSHCPEIGNTASSAMSKVCCSNMTTLAKLRYKAKLTTSSLAQLKRVDSILYRFHVRVTKNMTSFPYALLYQPAAAGGVGLQRFTDKVQLDKISMMLTALHNQPTATAATLGLIHRSLRALDTKLARPFRARLQAKKGPSFGYGVSSSGWVNTICICGGVV